MMATFRELFEKYMGENASAEELIQLQQYIQDEKNDALLNELLAEAFTDGAVPMAGDYSLEEVFRQLKERAADPDRAKEGAPRVVRLRRWRRLKYAAAIILLVGTGATVDYVVHRYKKEEQPRPSLAVHRDADIGPGKDQAVLTLADGKKVILDSTVKGSITNQGGTAVSNVNGRICYQPAGGAQEIVYNTMTTARGNQYQMLLPDGTRVWLNAASSLRFPTAFSGPVRKVELTGEGYFAVARDARHPFIVSLHHSEVKVLGTEFNIMAYSDGPATQTTLVEGRVAIRSGTQEMTIEPGKMATVDTSDGRIDLQEADVDEVTAWRYGQLSFNHVDLRTIMRQISRWYNVDVHYEGKIPDKRFGGVVDRNVNLSIILDFLQKNGVHSRREGDQITILP
jgi:ferric-dicitrate binding protein FerR (iron transport regulator)